MKSNVTILPALAVTMAVVLASFSTVRAYGQSAAPQAGPAANEKSDPGQPESPARPTLPIMRKAGTVDDTDAAKAPSPVPLRKANQLTRLRKAMDDELKLSDAQKKSIDPLFDRQTELLKIQSNVRAAAAKKSKLLQAPPTEGPDDATVVLADPMPLTEFIKKVATELKPDQIEKFREQVDRLEILLPTRGSREGPLRRLRRALDDPSVAMTTEQAKEIDEILKNALRSVKQRDRQRDPSLVVEAAAKARVEVLEKLSPQQREKAEVVIDKIEKAAAEEAAAALAKNVIPPPGGTDASTTQSPKSANGDDK